MAVVTNGAPRCARSHAAQPNVRPAAGNDHIATTAISAAASVRFMHPD